MATTQVTAASVRTAMLHGLGGRMFIALWGGIAVVLGCRALGLAPVLTSGAVVVLTGGCCLGQRRAHAVPIAGTGWLVVDGFVAHRYGVLGFSEPLGWLLLGVTALALVISHITRDTPTRTTKAGR